MPGLSTEGKTLPQQIQGTHQGIRQGTHQRVEGTTSQSASLGQQPIVLSLLGGFSLGRPEDPITLPTPSERLVACLAVSRCARLRSQLAGTLWPEKSESRALANVRAALWQINKRCEGLVVAAGSGLSIGPDVDVDLWRNLDWCEAVLQQSSSSRSDAGPSSDTGHRSDLASVCNPQWGLEPPSGPLAELDLLPAWSDDWLVFTRQYHRLQWLQAIDELGTRMLEAEDFAGSLRCGLNAIGADYFHERGHELVIAALIGGGNRIEALRHYENFRAFMAAEMSMQPSDRIRRLVAAISPSAVAASV